MRKRLISIFLVICVSVSVFSVPALAGSLDASAAAYDLYSLGLFKGTDAGFELSRTPTRLEALIMAIRVLGKEKTALNGDWDCPFTDVPLWAEDYVGYGWQKGLTNGCSATVFGSGDEISGAAFVSLMLRALGYSDKKGDFSWTSPWALAEAAGISDGRYNDSTRITRGDVAIICDFALDVIPKNGDITLREQLQLASKAAPSALSANEISRRCSSAVFYLGVYRDDTYKELTGTGSGFFLSADGVAVTNYHVIEGASFARVTLISGESYDVTGLISRDIKNDVAILKVSKVSVSGNPVTAFHYLPVSSSSAVQNGDTVFTISCPLGLTNSISSGIVSNYKRTLDSTYYIQITAPISSGSSGGALLNDQGEVIGITAAAFIYGENMNLATPIDFLKNMNQAGNGVPLKDYFRPPAAKEYSLTADKTEIEVEKGDAVVVTVTTDCGEPYKLDIYNQTPGVAAALLGQTLDQYNTELYVVGIEEGVALIMVTFADGYGDPDAALKLKVVVKDPVSG